MDTVSHVLFGVTLGVLASADPVVAQHTELSTAIMAATLIGSNAPDFDTIVRVKGQETYLKYHRGVTHSLPALFVWPFLISLPLMACFDLWQYFAHLWICAFLAVVFHVLLDWFNAYGVQCFRPLNRKWQHLDVLPIFDPFLFGLHLSGLAFTFLGGFSGATTFIMIYLITVIYLLIRLWAHHQAIRIIRKQVGILGEYTIIPSLHWCKWQFIIETDNVYYTGTAHYRNVEIKDFYQKELENEIIEASKGVDGVRTFITFAAKIHVKFTRVQKGYEVQWRDVRFWYNQKLPYGINVILDEQLNVIETKLGWSKKSWDPPYV